ncbi:MAG: phosphate ABC transporter permease subunit PstC [Bacteroidales bacterium]|nr:phosphate ABC transporter permease subunit PstC [Bacteroidales bacterium]
MNVRTLKDRTAKGLMLTMTVVAILTVVAIAVGLYLKSRPVLDSQSLSSLLFGSQWKPLKGQFGFLPFLMGTVWVTLLAIAFALPISLFTAVYITEYARPMVKRFVFPVLDILAALPSVVYGVWGVLVVVPWISNHVAPHYVDFSTGYTVLAAGIVLGIMVLPLLVSLFIEVFSSVPAELREASLSLGATQWQTALRVVLRRSLSGILASSVLAVSRAMGETIAVLMVCGCVVGLPHGLLDACYPIPALIANNYGEMLSIPLYESALMFAALILFVVVLIFNLLSRIVLYRIEKQNE